jgi:hypothetical protein
MFRIVLTAIVLALLMSAATLAEEKLLMGVHSQVDVARDCIAAGGYTTGDGGQTSYGCVKDNCDGKGGQCSVTCLDPLTCHASTPSRLTGSPSLPTVLLNGRLKPDHIPAIGAGFASEDGVRNICGKQLQDGSGVIGCRKACGPNTCDYVCGGPPGTNCLGLVFPGPVTRTQEDTLTTVVGLEPIHLHATKSQIKAACGKIGGIDVGPAVVAGKFNATYGCFNDAAVAVVICTDGDCVSYVQVGIRHRTLNGILGVMQTEPPGNPADDSTHFTHNSGE